MPGRRNLLRTEQRSPPSSFRSALDLGGHERLARAVDEQLRWRIPARNAHGDERQVSVLVLGDRVLVVLPPGDVLVFEPDQALDLAAALDGSVRP